MRPLRIALAASCLAAARGAGRQEGPSRRRGGRRVLRPARRPHPAGPRHGDHARGAGRHHLAGSGAGRAGGKPETRRGATESPVAVGAWRRDPRRQIRPEASGQALPHGHATGRAGKRANGPGAEDGVKFEGHSTVGVEMEFEIGWQGKPLRTFKEAGPDGGTVGVVIPAWRLAGGKTPADPAFLDEFTGLLDYARAGRRGSRPSGEGRSASVEVRDRHRPLRLRPGPHYGVRTRTARCSTRRCAA